MVVCDVCMCVCSVLRRQTLKGKYYASIFIHYMPADKSIWDFSLEVMEGTQNLI